MNCAISPACKRAMQEFLRSFPRPLLVLDGGLKICDYRRKAFSVFGRRDRDHADDPEGRLAQVLVDDLALGDELALATARLVRPGDEETRGLGALLLRHRLRRHVRG